MSNLPHLTTGSKAVEHRMYVGISLPVLPSLPISKKKKQHEYIEQELFVRQVRKVGQRKWGKLNHPAPALRGIGGRAR